MSLPEILVSTRKRIFGAKSLITSASIAGMPFTEDLEATTGRISDFRIQEQQNRQWCWAAVAASIANFYDRNRNVEQCAMAELLFGESCCANRSLRACDQPWMLDDALRRTRNLEDFVGVLSLDVIKRLIDNKRPICCRIDWNSGDLVGHFVVLYGYSLNDQTVDIADPEKGYFEFFSYPLFRNNYRTGRWTASFITKPQFS